MTPVMQEFTDARPDWREAGTRAGDCFRAAIASLLDRDLGSVPHFVECPDPPPGWWRDVRLWFREHYDADWALLDRDYPDEWTRGIALLRDVDGVRYVVASGPSPRGPWRHSVVWDLTTWTLAHDPHPSGAGLADEPDEIDFVCPRYEPDPQTQYENLVRSEGAA